MTKKGVLLRRHQLFLSVLSLGSFWFSATLSFLSAPALRCPSPCICLLALGRMTSRAKLGILQIPSFVFVFFPSHFLQSCSLASVFSFQRLDVSDSSPWRPGTMSAISWCSVLLNPLSLLTFFWLERRQKIDLILFRKEKKKPFSSYTIANLSHP